MKEPLNLLDYLKSVLDPRVKAISVKDLLADAETETGEARRPVGEIHFEPSSRFADAPVETAHQAQAGQPPETAPAGQAVQVSAEPEPNRPVPWRTLLAVFLVLLAQSALEPPGREAETGVLLYAFGIALGAWALLSGELKFITSRVVSDGADREDYLFRRGLLTAAFPVLVLAFFSLGNNQFNLINLMLWIGGLGLLAAGLWLAPGAGESRLRALLDHLKPPYIFQLRWVHLAFLGSAAVLLYFRFYMLAEVPSQMFSDHAEKLQDVQDVLNGQTHIFFPRNTGREFVQMYLTAFTAKYLGYDLTFMALKMGTALAGLITLPYIYLLGVELSSPRVGWLATLLAGTSYWLNVVTRVALRFSLYPLFAAPTLYYVVRGLRRKNRNDFILGGIFLGLGLHGYSPFRFVPILVVLSVLLYMLHNRQRTSLSRASWHLALIAAVSFVVFLPLLRFMLESEANMSIVLYRSLTRISSLESDIPGSPLAILAANMWKAMIMFAWDNGSTWVHSVVGRPALEVVSAAFFYLGYFLLLFRYIARRRWEDGFLLIAVPMLVLPSAMSLAFPAENPSLNRTSGAIIPVFIIAAMAFDGFMGAIERWLSGRSGRAAAWGIAGLLLVFSAVSNYDLVFHDYDRQFTASSWNTTELGAVIRSFSDSIGSEDQAWVIPWPHWVDTRLVGINAGVYIRDYAIPREQLPETQAVTGPKLFLLNTQDLETLDELYRLYPSGSEQLYVSEVQGKDFIMFLAP